MKSERYILIMRHGVTDFNLSNRIQGVLDSVLTDEGEKQVQKAANYIQREINSEFDLIITSPLKRTKQTAEIIAKSINVKIKDDSRLEELKRGILEGKFKKDLSDEEVKWTKMFKKDPWNTVIPGAENFRDLKKRVSDFIADMREIDDLNTIVVTHGYVIRMLLYLLKEEKEDIDSFSTPHNRLFRVSLQKNLVIEIQEINMD